MQAASIFETAHMSVKMQVSCSANPESIAAQELPARDFLDLTKSERDEGSIQLLREILTTSRKIVVVAGAGISVAAGIPDFRGSKGMFAQMKAKGRGKQSSWTMCLYDQESDLPSWSDDV